MWTLVNTFGLGLLLVAATVRIVSSADSSPPAMVTYIAFPTLDTDGPLIVAGRLMIPRSARRAPGKPPAVLIVHGSAGVDTRGPLMANALLHVGIATLEIDMWTPRRLRSGGGAAAPAKAFQTIPDAFSALKFLSTHPLIDPARIGITGFSLGGAVSMLTASKPVADQYGPPGLRFRAHAPFYPLCWSYNRRPEYVFKELTGAPVLIQGGELDTYDEPDSCQKLVDSLPEASQRLVRLKMYPGATHKFDATEPAHVIKNDPGANLGRGGEVQVTPNPAAGEMARETAAQFFVEAFGLGK